MPATTELEDTGQPVLHGQHRRCTEPPPPTLRRPTLRGRDAPHRFVSRLNPVLPVRRPALPDRPPRATLGHTRRASRGSACRATSAAERHTATSTSSMWAWQRRSAARAAASASGSSASPRRAVPACGGRLIETEERRRETKAGFATRKECQAAMAKVLVAVEESSLRRAHQDHRARVPAEGVAAGHPRHDQTDDLPQLRAARRLPHRAPHRHRQAGEALRRDDQRPLRQARPERQEERQERPLRPLHPPRARRPAPGAQGRRAVGPALAQPHRVSRPAQGERLRSRDEDLERRAAGGLP